LDTGIMTILLVEDNPRSAGQMTELLNEGLLDIPFTLVHAESLAAAVDYIGQHEVSLLLLDLALTDSDVPNALRSLSADKAKYPIIVMTVGTDEPEEIKQAVRAGAQDYFIKDQSNGEILSRSIRYAIEHKETEARQRLIAKLLEVLNSRGELRQIIRDILLEIWNYTSVEAIGLRLSEGDDYPYYETSGFPENFVEAERSLCIKEVNGKFIRDPDGSLTLDCMCGNVLKQRSDSSKHYYTSAGSFWSNDTSEFIHPDAEEGLRIGGRNRCFHEGYKSVALIPLRSGNTIIGLLQLNDKQPDRFTPDMIRFYEEIGSTLGITFDRIQTEKKIQSMRTEKLEKELSERIVIEDELQSSLKTVEENRLAILNIMEDLQSEIEERKGVENSLRKTEESFRSVVSNAIDGIVIATDSGTNVFANNNAMQITGYSAEEICGIRLRDLIHHDERETLEKIFRNTGDGKPTMNRYESVFVRKDGTHVQVELGGTSAVWEGQRADIVYFRDITERKQVEMELIAAKERAERSDKLKDSFISNISHEIRTPLNVITGFTGLIDELFSDRMTEGEEIYFNSIQRGSERLIRTVDEILNYSRLQVDDLEITLVKVDMVELTSALVFDSQIQAKKKGIELGFSNNYGTQCVVNGDPYYIRQALQNLIDNAIKFTKKGEIILRLYATNDEICVDVSDTGIGISPAYLEQIFEPFSQEEIGFSRAYEGIGLGLALVRQYLTHQGASITVQSQKGIGTTFTIHWKKTESEASEEPTEKKKDVEPEAPVQTSEQKPLVLVVEDDNDTIIYMKVILDRFYEALWADSAEQVWEILREQTPDLILMDISLQGRKSGIELTKEIRADANVGKIPIIAVTAHAFPQDRVKCLEAGCDEYIKKPVNRKALFAVMQELLSKK
jgi:PAS domain S-box-containing protein